MQEAMPGTHTEPKHAYRTRDRSRDGLDHNIVGDLVKGAIAGAAAVWVMDRIGWQMYLNEDAEAFLQEKEAQVDGKYVAHVAASKMANAAGIDRTPDQEYRAGKVVHYMLGMMPGAAYAALRNRVSGVGAGRGLLYGFMLFAIEDEGIAPALGLASGPRVYPWQAHSRGLVSHLVLGAATHAALDVLDQII